MARSGLTASFRWLLAPLVVLLATACMQGPDGDSGPDAYRHQAVPIQIDQPVPDTFSWSDGDRTDWKVFALPADTLLTVNVHFVNVEAGARVQLYDTYGKLVVKHIKESGKDEHLQFSEPVQAGRYFLRVSAYDEGDASEYTVVLKAGEANE